MGLGKVGTGMGYPRYTSIRRRNEVDMISSRATGSGRVRLKKVGLTWGMRSTALVTKVLDDTAFAQELMAETVALRTALEGALTRWCCSRAQRGGCHAWCLRSSAHACGMQPLSP